MKHNYLLLGLIILLSGNFLNAQNNQQDEAVEVLYPIQFGVSRPLYELFEAPDYEETISATPFFSEDRKHRPKQNFVYSIEDGPEYGNDERTIQRTMGNKALNPPLTNWAGQSGGGSCPPDPTGAAGPNHYVQSVNATPFRVHNKTTGAQIGTIRQMGSLWSPAVGNMGDPIVMYDRYADRWFLAQFGSSNRIYIAISTTPDPTGTYYTYTYTSPQFPDYLKFSIWSNGYYMTANTGTQRVWCFERDAMLAGNANARSINRTFTPGGTSGFFAPLPADADGGLPPANAPLPFFSYSENAWGGGNVDGVKIWQMTVDWTPSTPTSSISGPTVITTAAFDGTYNSSWNDVLQGSGTQRLDGIGGVVTYRAQYMRWTGYNTVVLNWGVRMSNNITSGTVTTPQRAIKWVELRQDQTTGTWSLYQEGIYSPDDLFRWVGSIAMDDNGSISLCYAASGPQPTPTPVGLRYTGRLATDPLGEMTFQEQIAQVGSGSMTGCGNRFGDYSHTSLDPDGITFWHTAQFVSNGSPATRIYSFQIPTVTGEEEKTKTPELKCFQQGNLIQVNAANIPYESDLTLDLFDINGRTIQAKMVNAPAGQLQAQFDINGLAKGLYLVRIGKQNTSFQRVVKVPVN
jgi:hypothetical protein